MVSDLIMMRLQEFKNRAAVIIDRKLKADADLEELRKELEEFAKAYEIISGIKIS